MSKSFKSLVQGASVLGAARVAEFIVGLLRVKVSVVLLGVTGMGIYNQLNFLSQQMSVFTLLSTGDALVKQIAESSDSEEARQLLLSSMKSYIILMFIFMLLSLAILYVLSEKITLYVFGDIHYFQVFLVALASLPLLVVNSIPFSLMRAFKDIKEIAKARVLSVFINILHTVPFIYCFALKGAVASVFFSHLVVLTVNYLYSKKLYFQRFNITIDNIVRAEFVPGFIKELLKFSGFGLSIGLYVIASEFVCRAIVVSYLGVEAIGLYSPVIMWSTLFTGFLVPALSTYLYSGFCQSKNNKEISDLLNDGLRLATFALIPFIFIAIPFRKIIIVLFYSSEFIEVEEYLPFHLLGIVFRVWFLVLVSSMSSTGRIKQHGIFYFFYLTLDIVVTYFCVLEWGLYGWMLKHIVSPVVFYFIYTSYCSKSMCFSISKTNIYAMTYLILGSFLLIAVDSILDTGEVYNYVLGPALILLSYLFLRNFEKTALITLVFDGLSKVGLRFRRM